MQHYTDVTQNECPVRLIPLYFGHEACEKSHSYGPAVRTHWLIHFVVSGRGIFKIGGSTYNVKAGEMFIAPPYEEIYYEADAIVPWKYIWIGFSADKTLHVELSPVISCSEAEGIFLAIKSCKERLRGRSAYLTARLWDLISVLSDENTNADYSTKALEYIHSNYMHNVTIEEIAQKLSVDRTYLSALFKKNVGISPKQYLIQYRMNIAASLLEKREMSVSLAAYSVGYYDVFNFSKMFKKHFGVSPKQYTSRITEKP